MIIYRLSDFCEDRADRWLCSVYDLCVCDNAGQDAIKRGLHNYMYAMECRLKSCAGTSGTSWDSSTCARRSKNCSNGGEKVCNVVKGL